MTRHSADQMRFDPRHRTPFRRFNAGEYSDTDPSIRRRLVEYFSPHNRRLYELLGRDFGWPA